MTGAPGLLLVGCDWLEGEILPHSVTEFREKMMEFADGEDVYGVQYIKKLLKG